MHEDEQDDGDEEEEGGEDREGFARFAAVGRGCGGERGFGVRVGGGGGGVGAWRGGGSG